MLWKKNVYNQVLKFLHILKQYPEFQQISSDKFTDVADILILVKYSFCLRSNLHKYYFFLFLIKSLKKTIQFVLLMLILCIPKFKILFQIFVGKNKIMNVILCKITGLIRIYKNWLFYIKKINLVLWLAICFSPKLSLVLTFVCSALRIVLI